ncbi:amino acid adenylation domain-containing protein [Amycolatopsis sp. lyj-346]|uniref:amino acid adenylation domain-containing protein n=1 Tax=Amycolatopsis sp. lyj-346 TaxID=2789289 RepID=UPI003978A1A9
MNTAVTVAALVDAQAARRPGEVAVSCGGRRVTYAELDRAAARVTGALRRLGAGPDQCVGVCLGRSADVPAVLLGILRAGAAYLPLDPAYPADRLRLMIADARPPVVLTTAATRPVVPARPGTAVLTLDELGTEPAGPVPVPGDALAYVLYTSGSTGRPHGVGVPHRAIVNLVLGDCARFGADEVFLHAAPLAFDASTFEIWGALAHGARLAIVPEGRAGPGELAETIRAEGVTTAWLTASLFHLMVREHPAGLRPLRQLLAGGDVLSPSLVRRAVAALPEGTLVNAYGPTEATTFSTCGPVGREPAPGPVPIGGPIAGVRAYVLDEALGPCPAGTAGELYLSGAGLARGYHGAPALTARRFLPDPFAGRPGARMFRTGDRVRQRADGAFEFLGRLDDQVKVRGHRVDPGAVAAALRTHHDVDEAVVTAGADPAGNHRLAGYVTLRPGGRVTGRAIRWFLTRRLPEFEVPATVTVLDRLPMTANGKVDRTALPAPVAAATGRAPRTPAEERVADTLAEITGTPVAGVDDGFFDLGVDSVQLMRLAARLGVPVRTVFDAGTSAELARRLPDRPRSGPAIPAAGPGPARLSPAQERLWVLDQLGGSAGYVVPMVYRLRGPLDTAALAWACAELVRRHEGLRTVFPAVDGVPEQRVLEPPDTVLRTEHLGGLSEADRTRRCGELVDEVLTTAFDLAGGPVFRAVLVELAPDEHVLAWAAHHIVVDGWSMGVLRRELGELHRARTEGRPPDLPPLPVRYRDFAAWDRRRLDPARAGELAAFWRAELRDVPVLELPADRVRPAALSRRGGAVEAELTAGRAAALRGIAADHGVTVFLVALAAFQVLLARYSGQRDFAVGVPVAGRGRPELDGLVGFFVNTVVFRARLDGDPSFGELLTRTGDTAAAVFAHQDLPFERLVDTLAVPRGTDRHPLVQVFFAGQNTPAGELDLPGVRLTRLRPPVTGSKFDLALSIEDTEGTRDTEDTSGGGLRVEAEYSLDLFTPETVHGLVERYLGLLDAVTREPDTPISRLPLPGPATAGRAGPVVSLPARDVPAAVARQAAIRPAAVALSCRGDRVTYRELEERAGHLARQLVRLGAGPERLVGVCAERGPELPVLLLAVLKTGAAYLPLDPGLPAARLARLVGDAAPVTVVSTRSTADRLPGAVLFEDLSAAAAPDVSLPRAGHPDSLAYVMYTSGSTGRPKGVAVTHRGVLRLVADRSWATPGPAEVLFQLSPPSFDIATLEIWGALANGARLAVFPPGADPVADAAAEIERAGVTTLVLATPLFHEIVHSGLERLRGVRRLMVGGDVLAAADARHAAAALPGCRIFNGYGPTEGTTLSTVYPVTADAPAPVPIGAPVGGSAAYVLDDRFAPVPPGVPGELFLGGPALARGYLGAPAATAKRFVPDPFGPPGARLYRTGDRARWRPGGALEFLGRVDHQVKIRGFRVELEEVEAVLREHDQVRDAVVTLLGDDPVTRRLVASVVADADVDLRGLLAARLPSYMVPSRISRVPELPRTPAGKPDRRAVAAREAAVAAGPPRPAGRPPDAVEKVVADVWAGVLGGAAPGTDDNFFEAGGNSLLLTRVRARLREESGRDVALVDLVRHPTIAALARFLRGEVASPPGAPEPPGARARMRRQRALRSAGD